MTISILTKEKPSLPELKKFKEFSDKHWGQHYDSDEDLKENFFDKPAVVVLAYADGLLIGVIDLFIRKVIFEKTSISLGGIGGVVTHTKYRHKGVATMMLEKALDIFRNKNVDVALLATDIPKLESLYGNVGFVPLGKSYYFISKSGIKKEDKSGMIAPVKSMEILNQILSTKDKINIGRSNF